MYIRYEIKKENAEKWQVLRFSSPSGKGTWLATFRTERLALNYVDWLRGDR